MSVHLSSLVWKLDTRDAATKLVLLKLADNANDSGLCWPSLSTICKETGLGKSTVCRKMKQLEDAGTIVRVPGHTGTSTRYTLHLSHVGTSPTMALVPQRDRDSATTRLPPVPPRDYPCPTVGHQPSLNHQSESSGEPSLLCYSADFEAFWTAYPRRKRKSKGTAWKAWTKIKPRPDLQSMLTALASQSASEDWRSENGKFIPLPATWLNGNRWDDEVCSTLDLREPIKKDLSDWTNSKWTRKPTPAPTAADNSPPSP